MKISRQLNLFFLFAIFSIYGCVSTPVGQIADSKYVWDSKYISGNYQEVYRRVNDGFRGCDHKTIKSFLYTETKEANVDVYLANSQLVMGVIKIKEVPDNSVLVKIGVIRDFDNPWYDERPGKIRKNWMSIAEGVSACE